jgi:ABC-type nitrate/sulfonate/bicarbonate transport system substrate-binding protein
MLRLRATILVFLAVLASLLGCSCRKKPPELERVTLRLNWTPSAEHAFIYLGIDKGFYREENIHLVVYPGEGSTVVAKLIGNKSNDFGLISGDILVMSRIKGMPIKALATLYHESPATIYSLKEKGITEPADLEGKKLGVHIKSTTFQQYQGMLRNAGVDREKITEVPASGSAQELLTGKVDAAMHYTNYVPVQIRHLGHEVNEILLKDYGINIYSQSVATHADNIEERSFLVRRFTRATLRSLAYSRTHTEEALQSLLKHNPELDEEIQAAMLARTNELFFDSETERLGLGYMTGEGWRKSQKALFDVQLIDEQVDESSFYDNRFWEAYRDAARER